MADSADIGVLLRPTALVGGLQQEGAAAPLHGATWYVAHAVGDGLAYGFAAGALARARWLTADLLLDGSHLGVFRLTLQEGERGPTFELYYGLLNQCSARMAVDLEAVHQNRWQYPRRGAWLKPMCGGQVVDLAKVDRITVTVLRKSDRPVRWCMTPVSAVSDEPPPLDQPLLPRGPLLDELGQSTLHDWPTKSRSAGEVTTRLRDQLAAAAEQRWPETFSRWGGWRERRTEGTGFFRTHHDGRRWWLVDPDGHLFWSAGMDCVAVNVDAACAGLESALTWLPDADGTYADARGGRSGRGPSVNYLAANLIRAFGPDAWRAQWAQIALAELRRVGTNTVGNWSDWHAASEAGFPYVRPLSPRWEKTPLIFRDFPDVYDPSFAEDAGVFAEQLRETVDDPAMVGYFLMNEPTWGFAQQTPAEGMLLNTPRCHTRRALAEYLRGRYCGESALSTIWGIDVRFADIAEGEWTRPLTKAARADLAAFSARMVERLFGGLSEACKRADPHHLNLGARYYTVPPDWALAGMHSFDVFSMNCYRERVPRHLTDEIANKLSMPVLVGEWHFGALDVGLPGSGIGHVRDQSARGQAYRVYLEDAASQPACVGVHYFTLYDESALGRFDGENWNIGLADVCGCPYEPLALAARESHERMYAVASGEAAPCADAPEYLPMLFL